MLSANKDKYLGILVSKMHEGKEFCLPLNSHLQSNLDNVCDLVLEVFEATHCNIVVNYDSKFVELNQESEGLNGCYKEAFERLEGSQFEKIEDFRATLYIKRAKSAQYLDEYRVIACPINLPDCKKFGALVFTIDKNHTLSRKEHRILDVVKRDIQHFFTQHKEDFEIEKSSELQQLMLQTNKDWIFVKDKDFKIVYANDAFLNVYPPEMRGKVIGYTTLEEYDAAEVDVFLENDRIAFAEGISEAIEDIHMPDGSHVIIATTKQRFVNDSGEAFILGVCRDITDKEMLIRNLQKAYKELDEFTSIASHDLKSPLNAIRRLLKWIEEETEGTLPDNAKENLNFVVNRAERMNVLLNDLLTYAKIGRDDASSAQISLKKIVDGMRPLLDVKDDLSLNCDELLMYAPEVPIKTILLNLISNALKHNDKALPEINIRASVSKHYYIISVSDNGPGIPPKFHERIFKLFQTLKPRDEVEGSGMGLSVVKKYVDRYFGKVTLESDGENGATFTIYWPVKKGSIKQEPLKTGRVKKVPGTK